MLQNALNYPLSKLVDDAMSKEVQGELRFCNLFKCGKYAIARSNALIDILVITVRRLVLHSFVKFKGSERCRQCLSTPLKMIQQKLRAKIHQCHLEGMLDENGANLTTLPVS